MRSSGVAVRPPNKKDPNLFPLGERFGFFVFRCQRSATIEKDNKKAAEHLKFRHSAALFWSRIRDSNPPPTAWEAVALPDELTLQATLLV